MTTSFHEETDKVMISEEDFVDLGQNLADKPFLKHIELIKFTPRHFGLDQWTRLFKIPDYWMRRIYRDEVWKDTEVIKENRTEVLTDKQREILNSWLTFESPFSNFIESIRVGREKTRSRRKIPEGNDIMNLLSKPLNKLPQQKSYDCDTTRNSCDIDRSESTLILGESFTQDQNIGIASILGHKIQSEARIVEKAIEKMGQLSPDQEAEINRLFKDEEYMQFLNKHVQIYLKNHGVLK